MALTGEQVEDSDARDVGSILVAEALLGVIAAVGAKWTIKKVAARE